MRNDGKRQTNYAQILNIKCIVVHVIASTYCIHIDGRDVHNPGQKLLQCKWQMATIKKRENKQQLSIWANIPLSTNTEKKSMLLTVKVKFSSAFSIHTIGISSQSAALFELSSLCMAIDR